MNLNQISFPNTFPDSDFPFSGLVGQFLANTVFQKFVLQNTVFQKFVLQNALRCAFVKQAKLVSRLDYPMKKPKRDGKLESKPMFNSVNQTSASAHLVAKMRGAERDTPPSPAPPAHDPYEFSDEASSSAGDFGRKGSLRQSREDSITRPSSFNAKLVSDV